MTTPGTTAIVLAGGRSARFGRDKLATPLDGRPLIERAIDAVRPLATEILVVTAPLDEGDASDAACDATRHLPDDVPLVRDPVPYEGPLVGVLAGLRVATEPVVVVVAGDMPTLVMAVLASIVDRLERSGADAVVLDHDGRPRPLPMAVRRVPALDAAGRLVEGGERRLRALAHALAAVAISESEWRSLDLDGRTMRDIDLPSDLPSDPP